MAGRGRTNGGDVLKVVVELLVTNSDLRGALRTALTPYRLLRLALAHDRQQRLQEDIQ